MLIVGIWIVRRVDTDSLDMNSTAQFRNTQDSPLWTSSELSHFLGCSERQIYNLRKQGLPTLQVGGMIRFEQSKVLAWLAAQDSAANQGDERSNMLAAIVATGDDDNSECATADLAREFPHPLP